MWLNASGRFRKIKNYSGHEARAQAHIAHSHGASPRARDPAPRGTHTDPDPRDPHTGATTDPIASKLK